MECFVSECDGSYHADRRNGVLYISEIYSRPPRTTPIRPPNLKPDTPLETFTTGPLSGHGRGNRKKVHPHFKKSAKPRWLLLLSGIEHK